MAIGRPTWKTYGNWREKPHWAKAHPGVHLGGMEYGKQSPWHCPSSTRQCPACLQAGNMHTARAVGWFGVWGSMSCALVGQKLAKGEEITTSETNKKKNPLWQKVFTPQEGATATRKWQCSKWSSHGKGKGQNHSPIQALTVLNGSRLPKCLVGVVTALYVFLKSGCLWRT